MNDMRGAKPWAAVTLVASLLLAGCLAPPRGEGMKTFSLEAEFPPPASRKGPVVLVAPPRARAGYETAGMVYARTREELAQFARHRWVDAPARMLAPLIVEALDASGAFTAVVMPPSAVRPRLRLDTEVVRLRQDFTQLPSRVEFILRAQLTDLGSGEILGTRTFAASVQSTADDPVHGVQAANRAVQAVLEEVATWAAQLAARAL